MALDLSNIPQAPPRRSTSARTTATPTKGPSTPQTLYTSPKAKEREEAANGLFQLAGFGMIVTRNYADAGALGRYGPGIAHELAALADKNDGIAKILDYMSEAGPYAGLITAVMPLVLQIMANHKMVKAEALAGAGVVAPEALAATVQADMARQTAEALRAQREAEAEVRKYAAEASPKSEPEA